MNRNECILISQELRTVVQLKHLSISGGHPLRAKSLSTTPALNRSSHHVQASFSYTYSQIFDITI